MLFCCSVTQSCPTLRDLMNCSLSGSPVLHYLAQLSQTHVWVMSSNHLILCLPPSPPALNISQHQDPFQWVDSSHQVANDCSFSFSFSPSHEYSGLISFRIDCFDLLAVQGTIKNLLQQHSLKASILWCSAFFIVQLSDLYMNTVKNMALTIQTFFDKIMSLLFNTLSKFVIGFLPRSKRLLISWLSHHLPWFWSPRKWNWLLFSWSPPLFAMKWWDQMPCLHLYIFTSLEIEECLM